MNLFHALFVCVSLTLNLKKIFSTFWKKITLKYSLFPSIDLPYGFAANWLFSILSLSFSCVNSYSVFSQMSWKLEQFTTEMAKVPLCQMDSFNMILKSSNVFQSFFTFLTTLQIITVHFCFEVLILSCWLRYHYFIFCSTFWVKSHTWIFTWFLIWGPCLNKFQHTSQW